MSVAMHPTVLMSAFERRAELRRRVAAETHASPAVLWKVNAVQQFHNEEGTIAGSQTEIVNRDDVQMGEGCGRARLSPESFPGGPIAGDFITQHLYSDLTCGCRLSGPVRSLGSD